MSSKALVLVPQTPCSTCHCDCCSFVPVSEREINWQIIPYMAQRPDECMRLARQRRPEGMCPFVDMEQWQCACYQVRPKVCRYYGRVKYKSLTCPYRPEAATEDMAAPIVDLCIEYERDRYPGRGRGALLGVTITWESLLRS